MMKPERKLTIAGAGLVGSLLALFLLRRGYEVSVLERRSKPHPQSGRLGEGRSINLAISTRGLHALEQVGLREKALSIALPMRGRMVHPVAEPGAEASAPVLQPYGKDASECIYSISRGDLNALLIEEALRGGAHFEFDSLVERHDDQTLLIRDSKTGKIRSQDCPLLFATDGSASLIRQAREASPGFEHSLSRLGHGYKELILPAQSTRDENGPSFALEPGALHIWPRHSFMLIALPNLDGSFTCTLFLPFEGETSFASLDTPEKAILFFQRHFPDVAPLFPGLGADFFENPTGQMVTVKCFPWKVASHTLLLGDAAHAIVPFFGQGMNCGFEDCSVLAELLDSGRFPGEQWPALFSEFERIRKPNSDAIADMAAENFVEMRDKVTDPEFLLDRRIERLLMREFPGRYVNRYGLVTFSRIPYRKALEAGVAQGEILALLRDDFKKSGDAMDLSLARKLIDQKLPSFH